MDITASMLLAYSEFKVTDMPLFTLYVVTCIQIYNISFGSRRISSLCHVLICSVYEGVTVVCKHTNTWTWYVHTHTHTHTQSWGMILYKNSKPESLNLMDYILCCVVCVCVCVWCAHACLLLDCPVRFPCMHMHTCKHTHTCIHTQTQTYTHLCVNEIHIDIESEQMV